jgi:hypothetical protein
MDQPPPLSTEAEAVVSELEDAILAQFPDARFEVRVSFDGRIYLTVYSDAEDDFAIQDLVAEKTVDAMLNGPTKIHVMPRDSSVLGQG